MKNYLLILLSVLFTFSCQEYSDDGLPDGNGGLISNPDGTKKLKRVTNDIVTTQTMNVAGMPDPIVTTMLTSTETNYNRNNYEFTTVATTTTDISGMDDMGGAEIPQTDMNMTITTSATFDDDRLTELRVEQEDLESTMITRTVFSYDDNRIASITNFENNEQVSQGTFTFNEDNIVVNRTYSDDLLGNETFTFNIVDDLISNITIENSLSDNPIDVTLSRDSVNLTQAVISRGSESLTFTYTYDTSHYYTHNLGSMTTLEDRLVAEAIALSQIPASTTIDQEPLLANIEAGIQSLTDMATHNLLTRSMNGTIVETNSYTYDNDDYPIAIASEFDVDSSIDTSNIYSVMADTMYANLIAFGLSEEEAQAQVDEFLAMFDSMDTSTELSATGTIEYFD